MDKLQKLLRENAKLKKAIARERKLYKNKIKRNQTKKRAISENRKLRIKKKFGRATPVLKKVGKTSKYLGKTVGKKLINYAYDITDGNVKKSKKRIKKKRKISYENPLASAVENFNSLYE